MLLGPVVDERPVYTGSRRRPVGRWDWAEVEPAHGQEGSVCLTHECVFHESEAVDL